VIAIAALSGPLPKAGVVLVASLAALALLGREDTVRAWAMLGALALAPVLLLADIWHSPQLSIVHRHPLEAAVGGAVALIALAVAATVVHRRPTLVAPLTMLALPFRVPIATGNTSSNLLVPLYLVIAAGTLAWAVPLLWSSRAAAQPMSLAKPQNVDAQGRSPARTAVHRFERLLAAFVVLYALQSLYSDDFEKALQQMVFFYVPFALLLRLLRDIEWDRALMVRCLVLTGGLAIVLGGIGFVEYATKTLLLNPKLVAANDVHTYFTVNSVFFDPDIFGRYLALVMIVLAAVLIYDRRPRVTVAVSVVLAILWGALVLALSRSSLGALLAGLATLAAFRWKARPVLAVAGVVVVLGAGAIAIAPKTFGLNQGVGNASSGRANLVSGGLTLFGDRPIWGFGSGSFVNQYRRHNHGISTTLAASHTIPVTIAAEQGVIGEVVYLALVIYALMTLLAGARDDPARIAVGAAFLALILHTLLYADFLEDPLTWTLLGIGAALASQRRAQLSEAETAERRGRHSPAHV
jgi:putative inorganic carbon (hco3(-)) transporter